jgi:heterodisulfide reductase subunit C2
VPSPTQVPEATRETKERMLAEVEADSRFPEFLKGCYECGICVAACPSARFYDFSPRKITQAVARQDVDLVWEQMNKDVWDCSQCFSCLRCPRGNNPGGVITIMREVAVKNGLHTAKEALEGYGRIIYKIMGTGTQVSPDMIQPEAFPDWGPDTKEISGHLQLWRKALPPETLHTTSTAWDVADKTLTELYVIWHLSGVLDMIKAIDPGLHMILGDVMEELLEEQGYSI